MTATLDLSSPMAYLGSSVRSAFRTGRCNSPLPQLGGWCEVCDLMANVIADAVADGKEPHEGHVAIYRRARELHARALERPS